MTNPCKCKSESERLMDALKSLEKTFRAYYVFGLISVSPYRDQIEYKVCVNDTEKLCDSIEAVEEYAESFVPNGDREIIHRKFKL